MLYPCDASYEELERQWTPLLHKFAVQHVDGYDRDDVLQEMRIILWQAQQNYNPSYDVSFMTYLFRSCVNQLLNLRRHSQCEVRSPELVPLSLDEEVLKLTLRSPDKFSSIETYSLLLNVGPEAKAIASAAFRDIRRESWGAKFGLSPEEIEIGIEELRIILTGGERDERSEEV